MKAIHLCDLRSQPDGPYSVSGVRIGEDLPSLRNVLFSQFPEFSFPIFGSACLLPEFIRSRLDFLLVRFRHYDFLQIEGHGPALQGAWGLSAEPCQTSLETGPRIKSTRSRWFLWKTSPQDTGDAGVTGA